MLSTIILGIMEFVVLAIGFAAGFWLIIAAGKEERWKRIMGSIFGWILIAYALIISTMICFKWIDYIQTGKLMEGSSMMSPMMKKEGGCPMMKQMMKQMKDGNMSPMMKQMMQKKMRMQMKKQMQRSEMPMKKMKENSKGKEMHQVPAK